MRSILLLIIAVAIIVASGLLFYVNHNLTSVRHTNAIAMDSTLSLTSPDFNENASIPSRFTCDDIGANPSLSISGVPDGTKSLTLIMDDPDIPQQFKDQMHISEYVHWVLFNIPPETTAIASGSSTGTEGQNSSGKRGYAPPCPPLEYQPNQHRYFFKLYALDTTLALKQGASKSDVEKAMHGHIVGETQLIGLYKRN
jgi:Raf kinase inhibitor-like YbhB/YbcL family protein